MELIQIQNFNYQDIFIIDIGWSTFLKKLEEL